MLTPWSEITAITLVRDRGLVHEGTTIVQAHWMIVVDLARGDFLEITERSPSWGTVTDGLHQHFAGLIAEGCVNETVLWRARRRRSPYAAADRGGRSVAHHVLDGQSADDGSTLGDVADYARRARCSASQVWLVIAALNSPR